MIIRDESRKLPKEWTDNRCIELWDHATWLAQNGNPGGLGLQISLFPFVGRTALSGDKELRYLKPYSEWDYEEIRQWISENEEEVLISWQRKVVRPW